MLSAICGVGDDGCNAKKYRQPIGSGVELDDISNTDPPETDGAIYRGDISHEFAILSVSLIGLRFIFDRLFLRK